MNLPLWLSIPLFVYLLVAIARTIAEIIAIFESSMSSEEIVEVQDDEPQLLVPRIRSTQFDPTAREKVVAAISRQQHERKTIHKVSRKDVK